MAQEPGGGDDDCHNGEEDDDGEAVDEAHVGGCRFDWWCSCGLSVCFDSAVRKSVRW